MQLHADDGRARDPRRLSLGRARDAMTVKHPIEGLGGTLTPSTSLRQS